jgi:uncharacterized protein YkwD
VGTRIVRGLGIAGVVAVSVACVPPPASNLVEALAPAPEDGISDAAWMTGRLNEERSQVGVGGLARHPVLDREACRWSEEMARTGRLAHDPGLRVMGDELPGWRKIGENVGRGGSTGAVWDGLLGSGAHRANMVDPVYTHQGVCVVVVDGGVYVTQRFAAL